MTQPDEGLSVNIDLPQRPPSFLLPYRSSCLLQSQHVDSWLFGRAKELRQSFSKAVHLFDAIFEFVCILDFKPLASDPAYQSFAQVGHSRNTVVTQSPNYFSELVEILSRECPTFYECGPPLSYALPSTDSFFQFLVDEISH